MGPIVMKKDEEPDRYKSRRDLISWFLKHREELIEPKEQSDSQEFSDGDRQVSFRILES